MKAITLHSPWAWATCFLGKPLENRTWAPPDAIVQELIAIHAGSIRQWTPDTWSDVLEVLKGLHPVARIKAFQRLKAISASQASMETEGQRFCSSIVAVARIGQVDPPLPGEPRMIEWRVSNQYAWRWTGLLVLPMPIPCKGAQGLWTVPPAVEARILEALPNG